MDYVRASNNIGGYEAIAEAIVAQAGIDYLESKKDLYMNPGNKDAVSKCREITRFFHSGRYKLLTDVPSKWLIERLDNEFESWKSRRELLVTK